MWLKSGSLAEVHWIKFAVGRSRKRATELYLAQVVPPPFCLVNSLVTNLPKHVASAYTSNCLVVWTQAFKTLQLLASFSNNSVGCRNHVEGQILHAQLAEQTSSWTRSFPSNIRRHQDVRLLFEEAGQARTAPHNRAAWNRGVCCSQ